MLLAKNTKRCEFDFKTKKFNKNNLRKKHLLYLSHKNFSNCIEDTIHT